MRCVEAKKAREVPEATPIHIGIIKLNEQTLDKLEKLFNTANYIAKCYEAQVLRIKSNTCTL